jgi:hypothetical protein
LASTPNFVWRNYDRTGLWLKITWLKLFQLLTTMNRRP